MVSSFAFALLPSLLSLPPFLPPSPQAPSSPSLPPSQVGPLLSGHAGAISEHLLFFLLSVLQYKLLHYEQNTLTLTQFHDNYNNRNNKSPIFIPAHCIGGNKNIKRFELLNFHHHRPTQSHLYQHIFLQAHTGHLPHSPSVQTWSHTPPLW